MNHTIRRELRVALSKKAQPIWFRIAKWVFAISITAVLWGTPAFGWWLIGALLTGIIVHFTWRRKTRGWTQPWGGWNDIEAGRE